MHFIRLETTLPTDQGYQAGSDSAQYAPGIGLRARGKHDDTAASGNLKEPFGIESHKPVWNDILSPEERSFE